MSGDAARDAIARAGGLFTLADLARRWGVTQQRVSQLAARDDFPAPIVTGETGATRVYLGVEVDAWRAAPRWPDPRARENTQSTWIRQEPDGLWAYGITIDGEPAHGGFADTEREAKRRLRSLRSSGRTQT
jgi:hypothetical protein